MLRAYSPIWLLPIALSGAFAPAAAADMSGFGRATAGSSRATSALGSDSGLLDAVLGERAGGIVPSSRPAPVAPADVELPPTAGTAPLLLSAFGSLGSFCLIRTVQRVDARVWRGDGNIGVHYVDPFAPVGEMQEREGYWSYAPAMDCPSDPLDPPRRPSWDTKPPDIPTPNGRPILVADPRGPPLCD